MPHETSLLIISRFLDALEISIKRSVIEPLALTVFDRANDDIHEILGKEDGALVQYIHLRFANMGTGNSTQEMTARMLMLLIDRELVEPKSGHLVDYTQIDPESPLMQKRDAQQALQARHRESALARWRSLCAQDLSLESLRARDAEIGQRTRDDEGH